MLIFLDIDGVMVPAKGWKSPEFLNDGFPAFSGKATRALQRLTAENATVILTTSHKSNISIKEWKNIFKNRGINIKNIKALPGNPGFLSRKDEIVNWFALNNVNEDFVIIDDDMSLNELPGLLKQNFIQVSPYIGLTEEHLKSIKSVLRRDLQTL